MIPTRRLLALATLLVTLMLGACSTPDDLNAPTLEPQFGTGDDEGGVDVAFVSTGRIYSLSDQSGYSDRRSYSKALLTRRDASGNTVWTREVDSITCQYDYYEICDHIKARSLEADANGNTYALLSSSFESENYGYFGFSYSVYKYNASGNHVASVYLGGNADTDPSVFGDAMSIAVDPSGNLYAAGMQSDFNYDTETHTHKNVIAKYSTTGSRLWQRTSTVGVPMDITVSSTGSVYVVGTKGMARYSNSGTLNWTKPGNFVQVIISGSNIYTRYRQDVRKYDGNGKQLWYKAQSGLNTLVLQDMDGDSSGNVYLSGKFQVSGADWNAMTRKLNASGSVLWTKTYGTSGFYDDAKGIATINGSEIYTTGLTKGSLAHTNIGGEDGYVRKQSSTGGLVWMR